MPGPADLPGAASGPPGAGAAEGDRAARRAERMAEIAERNRKLALEAEDDRRRDAVFTALRCLLWVVLGALPLAWAFHTTDPVYGRAAFVAGIGIANGGVIFTLLGFYRRGEQRGDW